MPLDGRTAALTIPDTLAAALIRCGIEPVDPHFLDAHKAREVLRHSASWFYRHRGAVQVLTLALLLSGSAAALTLASIDHPVAGFIVALTMSIAVVAPSVVPVRGPALWRERAIHDLGVVHPVIRDSALQLQRCLPKVRFRLGELIQDRITLDPYLVAEYREERVVLGIWDGAKVIAGTEVTLGETNLGLVRMS